jgi:hypothetical protein
MARKNYFGNQFTRTALMFCAPTLFLDSKKRSGIFVRQQRPIERGAGGMSSSKQKASIRVRVEWSSYRILAATAAILLSSPIIARAQENGGFHELETKYIFGFTIGSSVGDQGDKEFEPDTKANFGKRGGSYGVGQTALEYEYTPTQFMQIELGPIVSYYSIHNVPGLDDRDMGTINGFEADIRSVLIDHKRSPLAVTLSLEPEFHSRDETSGNKVVNYGLETRLEADTELIKNRLYLGFNLLYEPETRSRYVGEGIDLWRVVRARLPDRSQCHNRCRALVPEPL